MRLFPKAGTIVLAIAAFGVFALGATEGACVSQGSDGGAYCRGISAVGLGVAILLAAAALFAGFGRVLLAWGAWALAALAMVLFPAHWYLLLPCAVGLMGLLLTFRPRGPDEPAEPGQGPPPAD